MEKFIVARTYCAQDYNADLDLAVIEVTEELLSQLKTYQNQLTTLNQMTAFRAVEFWDNTVQYYSNNGSLEDALLEQGCWEEYEDNGWIVLDSLPVCLGEENEMQTTCDLLDLGKTDVFWTAQDKHSGVEVETGTFTLAELNAILEEREEENAA